MPLLPPAMTALLNGYLAGAGFLGVSSPLLAAAISNGFIQYALSGITVNTIDVGTVGAGAGVGTGFSLPVPVLVGSLTAALEGAQIRGVMKQPLISAVANAVSNTVRLALANTVHAGVGTGTGKVTLVPNPAVSVPLMIANFSAVSLVGVSSPVLARAIAQGIDQAIPSTVGFVAIAGASGPSPGTGTGIGKVS